MSRRRLGLSSNDLRKKAQFWKLRRQGITELIVVMVGAESSDELGPMKDKRPHNGKEKLNNRPKGPIKFFHCDGSYMMWDCLKKSTFSAIGCNDKLDKASMRVDSIVHSVEAKRIKENGKKLVKCSNRVPACA
ncbi:hypothetical protein Goarm_022881 [Gossypium armourianum]|uniref:Uncharacterized protein n=1 Tax=Gossypium armourianum TaxID=34283 RepID=A0A7J9KET5_9ROSI|nr:hypothetical protein [Gossypium armourianum]